ncbi:MAG: hypothetical protein WBV85_01720 [Solirubrobacteraceae bacterium]
MPLDKIVGRYGPDASMSVVGDEVQHHADFVCLKGARSQLADLDKSFDVLQPCERYLLDFLFAARFRDASGSDFDGPGVALAAGLHEADLA